MYDDVKFTELKEFEKHIILLFDEMKKNLGQCIVKVLEQLLYLPSWEI